MAVTEWVATTTDASQGSNYSAGVPDDATTDVLFSGTSVVNAASGFGSIRARQTLTGSTNFANGDTVTVDTKTYTFVDPAAPSADGEVDLGGTLAVSLANLLAAINLSGSVGSEYGASMTKHTTCLALSSTATTLIVAYNNGGTAGNSIATTVGGGNVGDSTWGAATMSGGAADGATLGNVYIRPEYTGDLHTTGARAIINCGLFRHQGAGAVYLDVYNITRLVIDSPNYGLAAGITMTSALTSLEIIRGRATLAAAAGTALPDQIMVADPQGLSENLRLTADSTLTGALLVVAPGRVSVDGCDWTSVSNLGGILTIVDGAVTKLWSTGTTTLKATDTMAAAYIMAGDFDLTKGAGIRTVTSIWKTVQARLHYRPDTDAVTVYTIGNP